MPSPIQFCVVDNEDGSRMGKLGVPHRKVADWLNFLVSPRQDVQLISAQNHRSSVTLYFQASDHLYNYLNQKLSASQDDPALEKPIAS